MIHRSEYVVMERGKILASCLIIFTLGIVFGMIFGVLIASIGEVSTEKHAHVDTTHALG